MNRVDLIGRTTKDIILSYTPQTQTAVGRFTLAVSRPRRNGEDQGADFVACKVWGKRAETMERYVKKGHKIGISGRLETGSYKNNAGVTVYTTEVVVDDFDFLEPRHDQMETASAGQPAEHPEQSNFAQTQFDDLPDSFEQADDDLPF